MRARIPGPVLWLDRQIGRLATALAIIGSAGIVALIGIIAVSVVWRYGLNNPIFGVNDLSTITLILVAGSAVAYGARNGSHVSVDVIGAFMGPGLTRLVDAIMRCFTLGIIGLACYALFAKACGFEKACITNDLNIEHRYFYYFLGLCLGVYALQVIVDLLKGLFQTPGTDQLGEVH